MRILLLLLAGAVSLPAEFLEVRLDVDKMDCETCLKSLEIGLKRTRGVKGVTVSAERGAEFQLMPGNRITLEGLRDAIKAVGFTPKTAHVVVRGKAVTTDGKWRFEIDGVPKVYSLTAAANKTLSDLSARNGQSITVRGQSPAPPDPRTTPSLEVLELVEDR